MRYSFTTTVFINHNTKEEKSFITERTRFDVMERYEWLFPFLGTTLEEVNAEIIAKEVATLDRDDYATAQDYLEAYEDATESANHDGYELNVRLQTLLKANPLVTIIDWN